MRVSQFAVAVAMAAMIAGPMAGSSLAQTALPGTAPKAAPMPTMAMPAKPVAPTAAAAASMAPVNINTATEAQLDAIPQIGPKRAAAIIKGRPYKTVDELVSKKALSNGVFQKIKGHLSV